MARLLAAAPGSPVEAGIAGSPAIPAQTGTIDADAAKELLASVGFLLVPGTPFDRGAAYLMVALRPRPTLAHYDPERIDYWTTVNRRSAAATLEWPMIEHESRYAWGLITVTDRVSASNEFASFGGTLNVARDGQLNAAIFRSEAPILTIGGHSGPADPLGVHLAGFFGELRAAAGDPGSGRLIDAATPIALYATFLVRTLAIYRARSAYGMPIPRSATLLQSETRRLERDHLDDVRAGLEIECLL